MSNWLDFIHKGCIYEWVKIRKNNRRVLALQDKTCSWHTVCIIRSKEKLKTLFEKNRITNLQYLEGLEILKSLRKRKNKLKENSNA